MPGPTCKHCTPLGTGEVVRFPTPSWTLRLGGVRRAGLGCWRKGRGTLSRVLTILPSKHLHPLPSPFQLFAWARASVHPSSCALAPRRSSPLPSLIAQISSSSSRIWEAPATFFQSPPLNPTLVSPVWPRSYLQSCGLHTCLVPLPANTLSCASASPLLPGAPPHCRPLPSLSMPNLAGFIPLSIQGPQVHRHPSPSPCPAILGFSVSQSANPPCP